MIEKIITKLNEMNKNILDLSNNIVRLTDILIEKNDNLSNHLLQIYNSWSSFVY